MTDQEVLDFSKVAAYTFGVLIAGIILWRISVRMSKNRAKPKAGKYFDNKYRKHWDKQRD